jgi:hypothetical protein
MGKVFCSECHWFDDFEFECELPQNQEYKNSWYDRTIQPKEKAYHKNKNNNCPDFKPRGFKEKIRRFWGLYI